MTLNLCAYRATILCEDRMHYEFIRSYLILCKINKRKITRISNVFNNGTVLKEYKNAVTSYRKTTRQNTLLIAMMDADNRSYQDAIRLFDQALDPEKHDLNQPTRFQAEKILLFSPVRNIESWFYYIDTRNIDGETKKNTDGVLIDYKPTYKNAKPNEFVKKLKEQICANGLPHNAPASLREACNELNRI